MAKNNRTLELNADDFIKAKAEVTLVTSINISADQLAFVKDKKINLSALVRELLARLMDK